MGRKRGSGEQWRVLVLGAGPAQLGLLEAARAQGMWVAVCDRDPAAPGFALADRRCIVSIEDEQAVERLASALDLDGILAPGSDWAVASAARVAEKVGLSHPLAPAVALVATQKLRQREALAAAGVPQPRWLVVGAADPSAFAELDLELPFVVKAPDRQGRRGLSVVRSRSGLAEALGRARSATRGGPVLVEEFVEGPQLAVTGFCAAGAFVPLSVTEALTGPDEETGLPLGHVWPTPWDAAAVGVARKAVAAVGIEEGPAQVVLCVGRGGPKVISVAARLGADHDADLVAAATSVDLHALALEAAVGNPVAPSDVTESLAECVGGAAIRFVAAPDGPYASAEAPDDTPGLVWLRRYGAGVSGRGAAVLTIGDSREEALMRGVEVAERIRFVPADVGALL